jgi:hypothetical protein
MELLALAAVVAVVLVLIPVLFFGLELIILGVLLAAGVIARTLLGQPWVVQATSTDPLSFGRRLGGACGDRAAAELDCGGRGRARRWTRAVHGPAPALTGHRESCLCPAPDCWFVADGAARSTVLLRLAAGLEQKAERSTGSTDDLAADA